MGPLASFSVSCFREASKGRSAVAPLSLRCRSAVAPRRLRRWPCGPPLTRLAEARVRSERAARKSGGPTGVDPSGPLRVCRRREGTRSRLAGTPGGLGGERWVGDGGGWGWVGVRAGGRWVGRVARPAGSRRPRWCPLVVASSKAVGRFGSRGRGWPRGGRGEFGSDVAQSFQSSPLCDLRGSCDGLGGPPQPSACHPPALQPLRPPVPSPPPPTARRQARPACRRGATAPGSRRRPCSPRLPANPRRATALYSPHGSTTRERPQRQPFSLGPRRPPRVAPAPPQFLSSSVRTRPSCGPGPGPRPTGRSARREGPCPARTPMLPRRTAGRAGCAYLPGCSRQPPTLGRWSGRLTRRPPTSGSRRR